MSDQKRQNTKLNKALKGLGVVLVLLLIGGMSVAGCLAAPAYEGPMTRHFDGKKFRNSVEVRDKGLSDLLRWWWNRDPPKWTARRSQPQGPPPSPRIEEPGRIVVTHINHSTMLVQLEGVNILTDPVFSERVGPFSWTGPKRHRPPGVSFADLPEIDVVLISHNHYDHLDLPTLRRLSRRHQPRILVPLGNRALLERHGIEGGEDLDWGQETRVGSLRVVFLPSRHWSGRGMGDRFRTLWGAYVVEGPAGSVYFAGDTGWGPHFKEVRRRFGDVRLALLPIGAYEPRWFMKQAHISPSEAVRAHLALGARTSVAMHYGTFKLSDEGQDEPPRALARALERQGVDPRRFRVLRHGHAAEVPPLEGRGVQRTASPSCARRADDRGATSVCLASPR